MRRAREIADNVHSVLDRIADAEAAAGREVGPVRMVMVRLALLVRRKPPHYKSETKISPYQSAHSCRTQNVTLERHVRLRPHNYGSSGSLTERATMNPGEPCRQSTA